MRYFLFTALYCILTAFTAVAQSLQPNVPARHYSYGSTSVIAKKNYLFLTSLSANKQVNALILADTALSRLGRQKAADVAEAYNTCKQITCFIQPMYFTAAQQQLISTRLASLVQAHPAVFTRFLNTYIIPSGHYYLHYNTNISAFVTAAWQQDAETINNIIKYIGAAEKPYYKIDSVTMGRDKNIHLEVSRMAANVVMLNAGNSNAFYSVPLCAADVFMQANSRTEAAHLEPLEKGANSAAYAAVPKTRWANYAYTAMLVPGRGPMIEGTPLSATGKMKLMIAAKKYFAGIAPFIIVSGGNVYPYQTPYYEAVYMKKYLVDECHVPASAIIIDPHARHTSTNMRNAIRLMYRYGFPLNKPMVIVTDRGQADYIMVQDSRFTKELGYIPYKNLTRINANSISLVPLLSALQADTDQPMDP